MDRRQLAYTCGIINLDSSNGPGTHWVSYVDSFHFDPFGLPPPKSIIFIKRYNTSQYQKKKKKKKKKISVLCDYLCLFFIKNSKMVIQFTTFCIKV